MSPRFALAAAAALTLALSGCAGSSGSASASASVSIKTGYFFGHDLRDDFSIVYVLDLSGSMSGSSGTIVEQAGTDVAAKAAGGLVGGLVGRRGGRAVEHTVKSLKKKVEKVKLHLIASINGLPQNAKFNVILFSDGVQKLAPGMIVANGFSTAAVSAFVSQLEEGGSTNMYDAVEAALYTPAQHIVVLTDGMPTSSSPGAIIDLVYRHNPDRQRVVSTVGVGGDQAREFLAALAHENGGSYSMYE